MTFDVKNYEDYVQLHQKLSREYHERCAACQEMVNDIWSDSEAEKSMETLDHFCRTLKKGAGMTREKFNADNVDYIYRANRDLPTAITRFKRHERIIKKEHELHAPRDSKKMAGWLEMFVEMNNRCETEWLPALAKETKAKNWPAAAAIVLGSPFFITIGRDNYPEYCESRLEKLCEKIPGNEALLEDYRRINKQGLAYYHAIPRKLMLEAGAKHQEKIIAQEKPLALAAAEAYINELRNDPHPTNWIEGVRKGVAKAAAEHTRRADQAYSNHDYMNRFLGDIER